MARICEQGNLSTERAMMGLLKAGGIKDWRRHVAIRVHKFASGRKRLVCPDFVFPRNESHCFINGCFWHWCPKRSVTPIEECRLLEGEDREQQKGDCLQRNGLLQQGWVFITVWAHPLKNGTSSPTLLGLRRALDPNGDVRVQP